METFTIGALAKEAGIAPGTLRYYEQVGLLVPSGRSRSGYRLYQRGDRHRLRFIRRAQELGFSLDEIGWLLRASNHMEAQAADIKRLVQEKLADIDCRIRDLERVKQGLVSLDRRCDGEGSANQCPILAALNGEEERGGEVQDGA